MKIKLFRAMYDKMIYWSAHRFAIYYLGFISFIESSFFPIPTSAMLAPMVMAQRARAWWLASWTTITSVLGGLFGYAIGYLFFDQVGDAILQLYGLQKKFSEMEILFNQYGVWLVFLAGVTPIPYKVFTITSGFMGLALLPFTLASLVGRAVQFFLVAALIKWGGEKIEPVLDKYMERIGWGVVVLFAIGLLAIKM